MQSLTVCCTNLPHADRVRINFLVGNAIIYELHRKRFVDLLLTWVENFKQILMQMLLISFAELVQHRKNIL